MGSIETKWEDLVYYDETSPTYLRWKIDARNGKDGRRIVKPKDSPAGGFHYRECGSPKAVSVRKKEVGFGWSHRIIWEMFNGPVPKGMIVDHVDGNPFNNRIDNLAIKTPQQNQQNLKKCILNTTGFVGVIWTLSRNNPMRLYARGAVRVGNRYVGKSFSVKKLGLLPAFRDACLWRLRQIDILNKSGAMYTNRGNLNG